MEQGFSFLTDIILEKLEREKLNVVKIVDKGSQQWEVRQERKLVCYILENLSKQIDVV